MLIEKKDEILASFKCQNSGNCCKAGGYVYVTSDNIEKMAKILHKNPIDFRQMYTQKDNGWDIIASPNFNANCLLDENNKCKVYEARPLACRTYPNWPSIWQSDSTVIEESKSCPGLKQAITDCCNI
jgi:Fe-S-cluster containining protein